MKNNFNYRPENWKEIGLDKFTNFVLQYQIETEYRQLFIDEDDVSKGVLPALLFWAKEDTFGVALIRDYENSSGKFYEFGVGKLDHDLSNVAFDK